LELRERENFFSGGGGQVGSVGGGKKPFLSIPKKDKSLLYYLFLKIEREREPNEINDLRKLGIKSRYRTQVLTINLLSALVT
jgi:hypothetical protein